MSALSAMLPDWESAFVAAGTSPLADRRILTPRLRYYRQAFEAILAGDMPQAVTWPLLLTWTLAVMVLPAMWLEKWSGACATLGLAGSALDEKMQQMDHFLDTLEETLEKRSAGQGI